MHSACTVALSWVAFSLHLFCLALQNTHIFTIQGFRVFTAEQQKASLVTLFQGISEARNYESYTHFYNSGCSQPSSRRPIVKASLVTLFQGISEAQKYESWQKENR